MAIQKDKFPLDRKITFGIVVLIIYLIFKIIINLKTTFSDFNSGLLILAAGVLIFGIIKRAYWAWILGIVFFVYDGFFSYFQATFSMIGDIFTKGFSITIVRNFIIFLGQILFSLPQVIAIIYFISAKNFFKNSTTGKFEKVMSIFMVIAVFAAVVFSLVDSPDSPEIRSVLDLPPGLKVIEPNHCGSWHNPSLVVVCGCDGELYSPLREEGVLKGAIYCRGECLGNCRCYQEVGYSSDPDAAAKAVTLSVDNAPGRLWVRKSCPAHIVSRDEERRFYLTPNKTS